jgi:hypothetical protein
MSVHHIHMDAIGPTLLSLDWRASVTSTIARAKYRKAFPRLRLAPRSGGEGNAVSSICLTSSPTPWLCSGNVFKAPHCQRRPARLVAGSATAAGFCVKIFMK